MLIRHPRPEEQNAIRALVRSVVLEIYGESFVEKGSATTKEDWSPSWIATSETAILGVSLTRDDWVDDLWIAADHRNQGVGERLLEQAELEIGLRGFIHARLRVVHSNTSAIRFYERCAWQRERVFPHEIFPVTMLEMKKKLQIESSTGAYSNP